MTMYETLKKIISCIYYINKSDCPSYLSEFRSPEGLLGETNIFIKLRAVIAVKKHNVVQDFRSISGFTHTEFFAIYYL